MCAAVSYCMLLIMVLADLTTTMSECETVKENQTAPTLKAPLKVLFFHLLFNLDISLDPGR